MIFIFQKKFLNTNSFEEVLNLVRTGCSFKGIWLSLHDKKLHKADFIGHASADDLLEVRLIDAQQQSRQLKKDIKRDDEEGEEEDEDFFVDF